MSRLARGGDDEGGGCCCWLGLRGALVSGSSGLPLPPPLQSTNGARLLLGRLDLWRSHNEAPPLRQHNGAPHKG